MSSLDKDVNGGDATLEQPVRILVVDDEEMIRFFLTDVLSGEGYEVTTVSDGQEAVTLLEQEGFDLIITDMVMPGLNGIEVLRAAKRIDPQRPVIVITGYPSVETVRRLVKLGADDYVTKPFNVEVIIVTVAKLLEMRQTYQMETPPECPGSVMEPGASISPSSSSERLVLARATSLIVLPVAWASSAMAAALS
jgi:DNA-binding response OmpR family regulator